MRNSVLVSGASGLVGSALVPSLQATGMGIARLMRSASGPSPAAATEIIRWDPAKPISPEVVSGFDAVIHLAGENIAGRWTAEKKARIRDSRIPATTNLSQALSQAREKPRVFISASAIGYYGNRGDEVLNEESSAGSGFAADLARDWEAATQPAIAAGIRTVNMRLGIVLAANGGALHKMLPAFKMGVGGKIGSGKQWMSWIDLQDVIRAIHYILKTDPLLGPVNLAAPKPVTNEEFTKSLASVLSRPAIFPMPAFAARLAFGEMAKELLLASQRVEPAKLLASGYSFRFGDLRTSLKTALQG
ncbi:MAG: TIGR01777 family oxidoreductase [Candidatus Sulfotelmatobacter sp.]